MDKKAGRPKVSKDKAKGVFFAARADPSEAKQINDAIARSGMTKSKWLRKTLLSAAGGDKC